MTDPTVSLDSIVKRFEQLPDPRHTRNSRHLLVDVITIAVCGVIVGCSGPKSYPKERVEVFSEGRGLVIDNWRSLRGFNWSGVTKMRMRQNKGHRAEVTAFLNSVQQGGASPIPLSQIDMVTAASFAVNESLRTGQPITLAYDW